MDAGVPLAAELLTEIRAARADDRNARDAQLRTLVRIADGQDRHEAGAITRSSAILAALGAQEQREAVVAERLAFVTADGKRERFAGLMAILRALPPPLKKELVSSSVKLVFYGTLLLIGLAWVHFKVPMSTIVEVAQAVVQPLSTGAAPAAGVQVP